VTPSLADIVAARRRIGPHVRRTPLVTADWLARRRGETVRLKLESLQATHSFKLRGALNAVMALLARGNGAARPTIVTASAGNHGCAIAHAAARNGLDAVVFVPRSTPRTKADAIRRLGATLRAEAASYDDAEREARALAAAGHGRYISPYNDADVIAGAGTIALELLDEAPETGRIVVPIGGGGLASGVAIAAKAIAPEIEIVGVEVSASPVFHTSLAAGRVSPIAVGETLADGLAGNLDAGTMTFDIVRRLVDRLVLVGEAELAYGLRALVEHEHLVAEGAGAVAVAAVLAGRMDPPARGETAIVVSGANIDVDVLARVLAITPAPQA
jgi:threonine dehydratase